MRKSKDLDVNYQKFEVFQLSKTKMFFREMDKVLVCIVLWHLAGRMPSPVGARCCHQIHIFDYKQISSVLNEEITWH